MAKKQDLHDVESTLTELESILKKLSSEDISLEESIGLYAKAADLIAVCNTDIAAAQLQIREIDEKLEQLRLDDEL